MLAGIGPWVVTHSGPFLRAVAVSGQKTRLYLWGPRGRHFGVAPPGWRRRSLPLPGRRRRVCHPDRPGRVPWGRVGIGSAETRPAPARDWGRKQLHAPLPRVPATPIPEPRPIIVPETNGRPIATEGCHR